MSRPQKPSVFDRHQRHITARNSEQNSEKQPATNGAELLPSTLLSPGIAPSSRYNAIRALARAGRGQEIALRSPSFRTRPSKKLYYRYHEKYPLESGSAATIFTFKALGIMPSWQFSGPRVRSSLVPPNEASQSKFLLSTLSATWPPPLERQDLPLSRH